MTKIDASFCLYPEGIQSTSIQPTLADRKRWFEQISDAIHSLHRDGYVWGDVKAANVLIDKDGNACLIDFEGGSDPDWIDYDLSDTKEGDLQGLGRLRDFLELDE
jgi:serine/threonine protein kinase